MVKKNPIAIIAALFLVIFIDQMGITFVFPVLTPLFMDTSSTLIPTHVSAEMRDFLYGLCLALYPLFLFIGAPLLGDISDQVGRKKILLACLLGSAASFILSAIAISYDSLTWLLISRAVAGFFSGSLYIAQAAIVDVSPEDKKAINLSYIIVAISVGMVLGPLIGGYFSDIHLVKWFTYSTPFEVATLLAIVNAALLMLVFKETFTVTKQVKIKIFQGFVLFKNAFTDPAIRLLSGILLFLLFGWTLYFQAISWILLQRFNFSADRIGLFIGYLGIGFVIALTVVFRLFTKYSKPTKTLQICLAINFITFLLAFLLPLEWMEWLMAPFIIGSMAICYTSLLAFFSNSVSAEKQGWIMGITGAVNAAAWTISGLAAGPLGFLHITLPLLVSSLSALLALACGIGYAKKLKVS